jgi:hypothetical protein
MLLDLNIDQINTALKGLAELPFKESYQVIMAIQNQAKEIFDNEQKAAFDLSEKLKNTPEVAAAVPAKEQQDDTIKEVGLKPTTVDTVEN